MILCLYVSSTFMDETLKEKTAKGLFWGGISNGLQQLLNLFFGIFLARLLTQEDYGMVGVLSIFSLIAASSAKDFIKMFLSFFEYICF